ncbi:MAG: Na+/H+ antiporter NhaA, partial [Rhodospirillales bacterium]|nr:Na+/H+ antiporter NhaA [Rhodospirillales bacterium]
MSLFIGTLSFVDPAYAAPVRLGVLSGSLLSGVVGYLILRLSVEQPRVRDMRGQSQVVRPQPQPVENPVLRN